MIRSGVEEIVTHGEGPPYLPTNRVLVPPPPESHIATYFITDPCLNVTVTARMNGFHLFRENAAMLPRKHSYVASKYFVRQKTHVKFLQLGKGG